MFSNFNLVLQPGELVALTGPNGIGKSSLALTVMGHPSCEVVAGSLSLDGQDLSHLKTHERARRGLFLAHQEPAMIPGISVVTGLQAMAEALHSPAPSTPEFFTRLRTALERLGLPESFADKPLHAGLSGGEKKRAELLSLLVLKPKYALLDEIDSGLDAAARGLALDILAELRTQGTGLLVISHNESWVKSLQPTREYSLK